MILYLLIQSLIYVLSLIFALFPTVTELPWGVDSTLSAGVAQYRLLIDMFPPLGLFLDLTLIYIGFRLGIMILRFFLGSRTPSYA